MTTPINMGGIPEYLAGRDFPVPSQARYILRTIEQQFDIAVSAGWATALPERRLLAIGAVAVDDPQLAVMFGGINVGPPGNEMTAPIKDDQPRSTRWNIELWRPIQTSMPSGYDSAPEATVSAHSEVVMQDSWVLLEAAYKCDQWGVGVIAGVAVNEPNGDMVGCSMTLEIQIP